MRTWADDLRRLCDALGLDKPLVLGSSFGGNVALAYAGLFPDHPGGVILASTTGAAAIRSASSRRSAASAAPRQPPSRGAPPLMRPGTPRLSSSGSATRCTAPRPAGPGNPASSWPG
jgi:pimeloyl-ACP methyl ester carboxylesterase